MKQPHKSGKKGSIQIRDATIEDLAPIQAVEHASFSAPWPESAFVEELVERNWSRVVVAEEGNSILAFMVYWVVDTERHLLNIATLPSERRQGIGSAMMGHLVSQAREEDATLVVLEVRESNTAARYLYGEYGFEPVALRPNYYADNGEDAVVMILKLKGETGKGRTAATDR